ncbi:MAG TPA: hypothetical protein DCW90_20355 [Lachnospiraceae bacterium]|nr:radical SAM protein [uncultured Lachnoclostridium sp.]HAU87748.1 hypothetical protein [Lachnospiraceae bacterium]
MRYKTIGIALCKKCNAECSMCCISATPKSEEKLELCLVKKYLDDVENIESISTIGITGGEVFLFYDELKELILYIREKGKFATVVTNGFWATDYIHTFSRLQDLKQCGLNGITISYDTFHEEYVSVEKVRNILQVSKILKIPAVIQTIIIKGSCNQRWINELSDDLQDVKISFTGCYQVGRAKERIKQESIIRNTEVGGLYCRKNGEYSVTSDGSIWPCCSPYITETALKLGSISDEINVSKTLKKIRKNMILFMLRNYGFDFFIDIAEKELHMELPDKVASSCELCALLFREETIHLFIPYIHKFLRREKHF